MRWIGLVLLSIAVCVSAEVTVEGRLLDVNGVRRIPVGMFGVHATRLSDEQIRDWGVSSIRDMAFVPSATPRTPGKGFSAQLTHYIECFWDRYHPALQLTDPRGWRERLEQLGRGYGEAAKHTGFEHRVEFWNEPYLNWASRPGVNYDPKFYEQNGIQEGERVRIRGMEEPTEHLVWRQGHFLAQYPSGNPVDIMGYVRGGNFQRDPFSPLMRGAQMGEPFHFQGHTYQVKSMLVPYDPTQFERESEGNRWWSGQQNRIWYQEMLLVFGEALKATNPDVYLAMGWGFHFNQGGWAAWRELYKPVLEASIHLVDAVHEHHYGGDTRMVGANYEVVWNWAMAHHGKSLEFWNTEAGGQLDPQRPDVVATRPQGSPIEQAVGAATYTLRDILYLLMWSPDKATARAAHEAHANGGDEFAFRMLRDLRGQLLSARSTDRNLWPVAALTDDQHLVVALFNDRRSDARVPVRIEAPGGHRLSGEIQLRRLVTRPDEQGLRIQETSASGQFADGAWQGDVEIPSKSAVVLRLPLQALQALPGEAKRMRSVRQISIPEKLLTIRPEESLETVVYIPEGLRGDITAARVRFAMINYAGQGGFIVLNGHRVAIDPGNWLHTQEIPTSILQAENSLRFEAESGSFGLWTASLELEYQKTPGEIDKP